MLPFPAGPCLHGSTRSKTVLVVESDNAVLHLCSYVIAQNGMSLFTAWEPGAATQVLAQFSVDLVVTSLDFPALDGVDLTHHVRSNYPSTQVIVFTPFGDAEGAVRAIRGGASDYLAKPFSFDEFQKKLKDWEQFRGPFRKWARAEPEGLPVERTLAGPPDMSLIARHTLESKTGMFGDSKVGMRSRHTAIVRDAVRTLRQIIQRDLEETALFAAISEDELLRAFVASPLGAKALAPRSDFYGGDGKPSREVRESGSGDDFTAEEANSWGRE